MADENQASGKKKTIIEEIEVAGDQLVRRVKELAEESSVRNLKIVANDGDVFLETPLNIGLVVGGVVVLAAPWLAILGAIAALVTRVRIVIEREVDADGEATTDENNKTGKTV